ncbi:MAG TPA: VC0807 family protein [Ktedonobacteraceae bacterium]|nr:VC0807 family protein [Ktedonobacteraceae bacterium]
MTVVLGLLLSVVFALLLNSPRLLLQHSAVSGLFGVVMLLSLLFPRPVTFYLIRSIKTQNDPRQLADFNASWSSPQVRSFYRVLTLVWGCVTIAQVVVTAFLSFSLSIPVMLVISPFLGFAFILPVAHWSMGYFRKNKTMFEQLRQQREASF